VWLTNIQPAGNKTAVPFRAQILFIVLLHLASGSFFYVSMGLFSERNNQPQEQLIILFGVCGNLVSLMSARFLFYTSGEVKKTCIFLGFINLLCLCVAFWSVFGVASNLDDASKRAAWWGVFWTSLVMAFVVYLLMVACREASRTPPVHGQAVAMGHAPSHVAASTPSQ